MNSNTEIFKGMLHKYKFTNDISPEIRNYIYTNKKKSLKKVLKLINEYSFIYICVLYFYFILRSLGLKVSMLFCKISLIGIIFTVSGSTSYFAYKYAAALNEKKHEYIIPNTPGIPLPEKIIKDDDFNKTPTLQHIVLAVSEIECSGNDSVFCRQISEKIYNSIQNGGKAKLVAWSTSLTDENIPFNTLIGRMHQLGDKSILSVKIVDSKDSSIKLSKTIIFSKNENIDKKIEELSQSIILMNSLWE